MKKILLTSLSMLICFVVFAQTMQDVPQKISYSGVVNKKEGTNHVLVKNTEVDFKVVVKQDGTEVFTEEHNGVKVNGKGQVAFEIGKGTNQNQAFNTLKWHLFDNPIIDVNIKQGGNQLVNGKVTIRTVPYAFHAQTARYLVGPDGNLLEVGPGGTLVPVAEPEPPVEIDPDLSGGPQTKNGNLDENHAFVRLAQYNVKPNSSEFVEKHTTAETENGFFNFNEALTLSLPAGYRLPKEEEFHQFMPKSYDRVNFSSTPVYKKIGSVWFSYAIKEFVAIPGHNYLEILAVDKMSSQTDAVSKLNSYRTDEEVAARYFPLAGHYPMGVSNIERSGVLLGAWSSFRVSTNRSWTLHSDKDQAVMGMRNLEDKLNVRPIKALASDAPEVESLVSRNGSVNSNHVFVRLAEYNLNPAGTGFLDKHTTSDENGYFNFATASSMPLPSDYRLPTKDELLDVFPGYVAPEEGAVPPSALWDTPIYTKIGSVHFRYYLKKFSNIPGHFYLEVLAVEEESVDLAKDKLNSNLNTEFTNDVAIRYFPLAGNIQMGASEVQARGSLGNYWSSTRQEGVSNRAFCTAFSRDICVVGTHNPDVKLNLRLIKN